MISVIGKQNQDNFWQYWKFWQKFYISILILTMTKILEKRTILGTCDLDNREHWWKDINKERQGTAFAILAIFVNHAFPCWNIIYFACGVFSQFKLAFLNAAISHSPPIPSIPSMKYWFHNISLLCCNRFSCTPLYHFKIPQPRPISSLPEFVAGSTLKGIFQSFCCQRLIADAWSNNLVSPL